MNNYKINEPAIISFSGGRSSGYMLFKILEAHGGKLPEDVHVCFANTGKEMPQTLDFVNEISVNWNIDIVWLENSTRRGKDGENKYVYENVITDYKNACRNGEPFEKLIQARKYLPNPVARFCTKELKIEPIKRWAKSISMESPYLCLVGIRGDEQRRAAKIHNTSCMGQDRWCPMFVEGVTAEEVGRFWELHPFDLNLPNNNGVTDWGNCDLCFLKGARKRLSIIKAQPCLADWWINIEDKAGGFFRKDAISYKEMKKIATDQDDMFSDLDDFIDISVTCFCGD